MKQIKKLVLLGGLAVLLTPSVKATPIELGHVHVHEHDEVHQKQKVKEYTNTQTYSTPEGDHTIYWANGVDAPLMSSDKDLLGTEGYFEEFIEVLNGKQFLTYQYAMEPNKGYYDLNKNEEQNINEMHHCYLGTAVDMLYWWINQNRSNIEEYVRLLRDTDTYGQAEGLVSVYPYNERTWTDILSQPPMTYVNGFTQQLISKSPIVLPYLRQFYVRDNGHFPDLVLDNFINGYIGQIPNVEAMDPNTEDIYRKDKTGGFFYNLFGRQRLTERYQASKFNEFNNFMKNAFVDNKMVSVSYFSPYGAHVAPVWGAEFDTKGELMRIYITDTDDHYGNMVNDPKKLRGLHTMEVGHEENGAVFLYSDLTEGDDKNFGRLQGYQSLDAATELFEAKLQDKKAPTAPKINSYSKDRVVAKGGHLTLNVDASKTDNGDLSYEVYKSTIQGEKGKKVSDTFKSEYKVDTSSFGKFYYTIDVVNNKNGKRNVVSTNQITVDVQDIPLVNAQMPNVKFRAEAKTYNQFQMPNPIKSKGEVTDGGTLSYQWYRTYATNGVGSGTPIPGATNPNFFPMTNDPGLAWYYCVVTNTNTGENITGNQVTSFSPQLAYQVRVNASSTPLEDAQSPAIEKQPEGKSVEKNESLEISTRGVAYDGGQVSYQWYRVNEDYSEVKLENETNPTLKVKTDVPGTYMYTCYIYNTNTGASKNTKAQSRTRDVTIEVKGDGSEVIPPVELSKDNTLKSLEVSNAKLSPDFKPEITSYETNVHVNVDKLELSALKNHSKATVTINNPNLVPGLNYVTIEVKAEDGSTNTYTIKVTKDSDHSYGEWIIDEEATCTKPGRRHKVCKVCNDVIYEEIPMKDHRWDPNWTIDIEATEEHDGLKSHHCLDCDAKKDETVIPRLDHTHNFNDWHVVKNPTCLEEGLEQRECSCGEVETRVIEKTPHVLTHVEGKPNSCLEDGIKEHWHCETCGKNFADKDGKVELEDTTIKATGHSFGDWIIDREPTETSTGLRHKVCEFGGEIITEEIPMLEPSKPEAPETSEPETSEPDNSLPETSEPDNSLPETSEPDNNLPETSEPETSVPNEDVETPETSEPETDVPSNGEDKNDNNIAFIAGISTVAVTLVIVVAGFVIFIIKH